jgi:sulfopyruvate decarboxylase TPP-binding subunit
MLRGTHQRQGLASYRDVVMERIKAGVPFGAVEDAIADVTDLTSDQKAALWLFAFSLRAPSEQQRDARAHLVAVQ